MPPKKSSSQQTLFVCSETVLNSFSSLGSFSFLDEIPAWPFFGKPFFGTRQYCSRIVCTVTIRKPADRGNHQEKRAEWTRWLCEEKPIQYMKLLNLKEVSQFSFKTMQWRGTLDRCWQFVPKDRSSWQEWLHCTGFVNAREWIHMTTEITTTWQS